MLAVWLCLPKISASRTRTHACAPTRAHTETHTHGRPLGRADLEPMEVGRRIAAARHVPYELIEVVRLRTVRAATYRVLHVAYSMLYAACCVLHAVRDHRASHHCARSRCIVKPNRGQSTVQQSYMTCAAYAVRAHA